MGHAGGYGPGLHCPFSSDFSEPDHDARLWMMAVSNIAEHCEGGPEETVRLHEVSTRLLLRMDIEQHAVEIREHAPTLHRLACHEVYRDFRMNRNKGDVLTMMSLPRRGNITSR